MPFKRLLLCIVLCAMPYLSMAETIYIARNDERESAPIVEGLSRLINSQRPAATILVSDATSLADKKNQTVIAIGEKALFQLVSGNGANTIISAFVTRYTFNEITNNLTTKHKLSAIFSDPSPSLQIALVRTLLGSGASIGILASKNDTPDIQEAKNTADQIDVRLTIHKLSSPVSARTAMDHIASANSLLLLRDKQLFQFVSLDDLMHEAYDFRSMAVVGYSSVIVSNGGLATTYFSTENIIQSLSSAVNQYLDKKIVPTNTYPSDYSVAVNPHVLRSLGFRVKGEKEIRNSIDSLLGEKR